MKHLKRTHLLVLLLVVGSAVPASGFGFRFFSWWRQPPANDVLDVTFDNVSTCRPFLYCLTISNGSFDRQWSILDDTNLTASVVSGVLTIDPFVVSDTDGNQISYSFNPATLDANYFGSKFRTDGNAVVDTGQSSDVPVKACGRIWESNGNYNLRSVVHGYARTDDGQGTITYKIVRVSLKGTVAVPVVTP